MSFNDHDVETALRDLADMVRAEPDPARRMDLFTTFLAAATDNATDGFQEAVNARLEAGESTTDIADDVGVHRHSVVRWINAYRDRHNLPTLGRPRLSSAVRLPPRYREGRNPTGAPTPGT